MERSVKKNVLLDSLIIFSFLLTAFLSAQSYQKSNQESPFRENELSLIDPTGKNSIVLSRGQQIKINDDQRKLFYQNYDSKTKIITVKDIVYKVFYTKHTKLDYHLDEIDKIQLRTDDVRTKRSALWYPAVYAHMMPQAIPFGLFLGISAGLSGKKHYRPPPALMSIYLAASLANAFINVPPTTAKMGRGNWMPIPLKGDGAWEVSKLIIH